MTSIAGTLTGGAADAPLPMRILALAGNPWAGQWMNRQQLLSRMAGRHHIVYSNGPWSVWDRRLPTMVASRWLGQFERHDGVWIDVPPRLLMRWPNRPTWDAAACRVAAARWHHKLSELGSGPVVAYVFHPSFLPLARHVRADLRIYHVYDMYSRAPGWDADLQAAHLHLLRHSDLVIASSEPIRAALQELTDRDVHLVPNGVDAEAFIAGAAQPEPPEMASIPRPRLGYVGSLNRKVDFGLVADLAAREPDWHFVLLGPMGSMDEVSEQGLAQCRQRANVHVLPPRSVDDLPACMAALDVGMLCYRKETWADFGYPLKLHEYLASGLPIVGTPLQSIQGEHAWIDLATGTDEWHSALRRCLDDRSRGAIERRQSEARANNWELRANRICELLETVRDKPGVLHPR